MTTRSPRLATELGYARHRLPMGVFDVLEEPHEVLELDADGIIEHIERDSMPPGGPLGEIRSRSVLFMCKGIPKYSVHTLLAPRAPRERWQAWIDRYDTWSVLVEEHPEFSPRDLRGRRGRHKSSWSALEELRPSESEPADASASFL